MVLPRSIAADPSLPGNLYVVDGGNARIDEFSPWGDFLRAWGWGVRDEATELQSCDTATGCVKGIEGSGDGQFMTAEAATVDGAGDVYVIDAENHRVQKFDPSAGPNEDEAQFVLMFGFNVNKTKLDEGAPEPQRNVCTAASTDVCQAGSGGSGPGRLGGGEFAYLNRIAASPTGNSVFVAEGGQIQRFSAGGVYEETIEEGCLAGKTIGALALDGSGNLYVAIAGEAEVKKLKPSGPTADCLPPTFPPEAAADRPRALALDGSGNLYVVLASTGIEPERVQKYAPSGECLTCGEGGEEGKPGFDRTSSGSQLRSIAATSACKVDDVYVTHFSAGTQSFFRSFGEHPDPQLCLPPKVPPVITAQYALSAEFDNATLRAEINPKFWAGSVGETNYYVQYGTAACIELGWGAPCVETQPSPPGVKLNAGAVNEAVKITPLTLDGLGEDTTYRYRFVAESTGGGPVYGLDPDGPEGEEEASFDDGLGGSFRTYRKELIQPCPANDTFRFGPSALLPDCRAYEMVSPPDKEGGDVVALLETRGSLPAVLSQSAISGTRLAYGSYRSFGGSPAGPYTSQYLAARRDGVAWETHPISPPRGKQIYEGVGRQSDTEFKAFSTDLCQGWLQSFAEPPLEQLAPAGVSDIYRRTDQECGGPAYEGLNRTSPPSKEGGAFQMELQGFSEDGTSSVFVANDAVAVGGSEGIYQLYGARDGAERFLCVLPGGAPFTGPCVAGGNTEDVAGKTGREANVLGAFAADGSRVYWTALEEDGAGSGGGPGEIYLRKNPFGEGPECGEEGSPCTVAASKAAEELESSAGSQFWSAAKNGSRALFTTGGTLYEYRAADETTHEIAGEFEGFMGASDDATRSYFASKEALGGPNAEGKTAAVGEQNLYFHEVGGPLRFIGELVPEAPSFGPLAALPRWHTSRVSPDGLHAAFKSRAALTGYDNTDLATGEADGEVFLYEANANGGGGELLCVSCNPSGARPRGGFDQAEATAGQISVFETSLYGARVLAEDGSRLYFESYDSLLPRDSNGRKDVYQWEALGTGGCNESSSSYSLENRGCIDLISSGLSKLDSEFTDATPSGDDIFFATLSTLLPQDYGLYDIYDARVGGGLPTPPGPEPECEGEGCQNPPAPPEFQMPATSNYQGPGNLAPEKNGCSKGRRRVTKNGKTHCTKKKVARKRNSKKGPRPANSTRFAR